MELIDAMHARHSVRKYLPKSIEHEKVFLLEEKRQTFFRRHPL